MRMAEAVGVQGHLLDVVKRGEERVLRLGAEVHGVTTDTNPDTGKDTTGGDNTDQGGSGTTGDENVSL